MEKRLEVDAQVIVHATENLQKILDAFKDVFDVEVDDFAIQKLQGHHDNPITLLQARLKKKKAARFVKVLISSMSKSEIDLLIGDLESRCSDSSLFLRISKQEMVKRRILLSEEDPVKLKIFTPIYSQKETVKTYSDILNGTI